MADGNSEASSQNLDEGYNPRVRWVLPNRLDFMTFIGKDIFVVAHDIYIIFHNFKNNSELVYVANNEKAGDGVDAIAGHKAHVFAFAEKTKHARIFIVTYPAFHILAELKDNDVNRYKGLCMMECDMVAGFSGFPDYLMSVWNWRTQQRLVSVPTGVVRRTQIYMASRTHMLVCQCWGEGLTVWEVAQCYRRCLTMKRVKPEVSGWQVSEPPLVAVCWSLEGQLYALDPQANLYSVLSDGIGMVTNLEWSGDLKGSNKPCICAFYNGLLIYGPDNYLRALKKCDSKWKVSFTYQPASTVLRLVSNATCDVAALYTAAGLLCRLTGDSEDRLDVTPMLYKQRHIMKIQLIAPEYQYLATMDNSGVMCIYDVHTGKLVLMKYVEGEEVSFETSPVESVVCVYGRVGCNYGLAMYRLHELRVTLESSMCLTHQIVSRVVFSPTGREVIAAAMSAGHIFIINFSLEYKLSLVRYAELGRGLADCFLMPVGDSMRAFSLVLFSDKYPIGERIICINAETGKDNKFAGKMQGPYCRLLPLRTRDHMLGLPHLSRHFHVLHLAADKGVTISVKMGPIIKMGHDIKQVDGFYNAGALLTFGFDGHVILRQPHAPEDYDLKLCASHRYETGIRQAVVDVACSCFATLAGNRTCVVTALRREQSEQARDTLDMRLLDEAENTISIINANDKNYLDLQEDKKVYEEAMDFKQQREDVVKNFLMSQAKLVELLEENLLEPPLHQLSLAEFNLHLEHKKERNKEAEREREEIRLKTESRIRAQDKVTLWIKKQCWDSMLTPRVKLFAIFSHYQVENYAVLPSQRDTWLELQQTEWLRTLEMENDAQLFKPWEEEPEAASLERSQSRVVGISALSVHSVRKSAESQASTDRVGGGGGGGGGEGGEEEEAGQPYVLAGSTAHRFVPPPAFAVPQTLAATFLHMHYQHHVVKLTVQNMRLWFNKQFDELMAQKRREVSLLEERNARLRFIIEELNKLSDLRGSFHHLTIQIYDPEWKQEELPQKLIKVEPEECGIEPYISPSQVVIPPPEPQPKDDFKERALIEMMDGVLEKLWHEEIKKPIPMPQCMLDKDPEHFNEEDLRFVFEYEAKVNFRNEERDKYRKMLHAEYAKLTQLLNEGVVKFNQKVKEAWLMKLTVDSVIGQENLNLMRLRRTSLDRVENSEKVEELRGLIARLEGELEALSGELALVQEQSAEVQAAYDALQLKDKYMERTFKNHFADLSSIIVDQCYKFFKKRPKWQQRATMTPVILYELATAVLAGVRPPLLHQDCVDFYKGVDQLDQISNMPPVMDETLWATMCKLRRAKIENEIRMRGVAQEMAYVDSATSVWTRGIQARRSQLALSHAAIHELREAAAHAAMNKTIQLVVPAGQVEITCTGHIQDFEDATLIPREDIEKINAVILKVGEMKLRMMRKQMEFRKGILAKEWEHAQVNMKLRHMRDELYSYTRLKIPKELQLYLKNKELGYTEEQDYVRMEKEMEASKMSVNKILTEQIQRVEELELKINSMEAQALQLEQLVATLNVQVSEKRLGSDPLEPIRVRRVFKKRMETLVMRSKLIREVQANHTSVVLLQTELELLRLKTYPTLASFRTFI